MMQPDDPLMLFDYTRNRLYAAVADRLPEGVNPTAYCADAAYWICLSVITRGKDWQTGFDEFTDVARLERLTLRLC